jgi:acetyltransferase-like isoleucine patch superfamily enzyme
LTLETLRWLIAVRRQRIHSARQLRNINAGARARVLGEPVFDASDLVIGDDFSIWSTHRQTLVCGWGKIRIGDRVFLNSGSIIFSTVAVTIEDDVALANEAYVMDSDSHGVEGRPPREEPVIIGRGSWIGARAIVLPGVTIGSRCIVAAGAVVSRDVPDETLVAGNPAKEVRKLVYPDGITRAWHN